MQKDLTEIIKTRWPEMTLIAGFMAITIYLFDQLNAAVTSTGVDPKITMSQTTSFLYAMTATIFLVIFLTLYLGFLATLNVNPKTSHTPSTLVSIGRIFFWRAIRLQILISIYYFSLAVLIFIPIKFLFFRTANIEDIPQWPSYISVIIAFSVMLKPLLLILPIMICKNLVVLPAVKAMADYRLSDMKILPVIFVSGLLIAVALIILQEKVPADPVVLNVLFAARAILSSLVTLATGIIGVWFVAGRRFGALHPSEDMEETQ